MSSSKITGVKKRDTHTAPSQQIFSCLGRAESGFENDLTGLNPYQIYQLIESIKQIEADRQLLLKQQQNTNGQSLA